MSGFEFRGPWWDSVADDAASVAQLYADLGQDTRAEPYLKRALLIRAHRPELDSLAGAEALEQYGLLLRRLGRDTEAHVIERRAERIRMQIAAAETERIATLARHTGVGFFVSPDGLMLTTLPAVREERPIRVLCPINVRSEAAIQESVATSPLSVLRVPVREAFYLTLATEPDAVHPDDPVVALDFPLAGAVRPTNAGGVATTASGPTGEAALMQIGAPVEPGNFGSPVLDAQGHVVGIVTPPPAKAIPVPMGAWVLPVTEALPLIPPPAARAPLSDRSEILALARASTCRIVVAPRSSVLAPGSGRIYFYWPSAPRFARRQPDIRVNGEKIGTAKKDGFYFVNRYPGHYEVAVGGTTLTLALKPSQERYVRLRILSGGGNPVPELADNKEAADEMKDLRFIAEPLE